MAIEQMGGGAPNGIGVDVATVPALAATSRTETRSIGLECKRDAAYFTYARPQ